MNLIYSFFEKIFTLVFAPKVQKIEKIILILAALGFSFI